MPASCWLWSMLCAKRSAYSRTSSRWPCNLSRGSRELVPAALPLRPRHPCQPASVAQTSYATLILGPRMCWSSCASSWRAAQPIACGRSQVHRPQLQLAHLCHTCATLVVFTSIALPAQVPRPWPPEPSCCLAHLQGLHSYALHSKSSPCVVPGHPHSSGSTGKTRATQVHVIEYLCQKLHLRACCLRRHRTLRHQHQHQSTAAGSLLQRFSRERSGVCLHGPAPS